MADPMDARKRFEALSPAFLEVTLPRASDFDAVALLRKGNPEEIARISGRKNLFFDERAKILIILKTSETEENVREILPSIELVVTAHATDAVPQGNGNVASASGKHDLSSQTFSGSSFLDVVSVGDHTYVVFEPTLPLPRPRARLQRPAVYFTATAKLAADVRRASRRNQKDYLKSYEPLPANVLEPLNHDPALRNSNIYLSETRVTKVTPPKPVNLDDVIKPIRGASKRAYPAVPALFTRIRYSTLPDSIIASLHVETSPLIAGTVDIKGVDFSLDKSPIEPLTAVALPLQTHSGDETIFLYGIPSRSPKPSSQPRSLSATIDAVAKLAQGSIVNLSIVMDTHLDYSDADTSSKKTYTWSRPMNASSHHKSLSIQSINRPPTRDTISSTAPEPGVIFTFTGPATTVVNQDFTLQVQCNNRSPRSRRFALVMLQPRKPHRSTALSQNTQPDTADLIANIFNAPPLERIKPQDVLDLNPDVRISPLPAGACFDTMLKFRALKVGVLDLGALRIVDLEERRVVDVRELPEVVALEAES
ncbi:unnamed protein product [Zymoseptoria tritici ST99CH_3D7]|uniref:Trafficking protein particle complex II-specific subunit 65 IgD3 domain-containing protein n=1 Tax=Zymoseptoria tritici (strain ST99CH_3D7) TaxID=1276538 RepID=A0A1X7RHD0_ZYMT9|nr:unnamed protein product [Zymoseptoria tritici ST99CH_3D7]